MSTERLINVLLKDGLNDVVYYDRVPDDKKLYYINNKRDEVELGTLPEIKSRNTDGTSNIKDKEGHIIGTVDNFKNKLYIYGELSMMGGKKSGGKRKTHRNKKSKKVRKSKSRKNRRKTARR